MELEYAERLAAGEHLTPAPAPPIAVAFREFDRANPGVYAELVRLARLWVARRGVERLGIATLYEVARWNLALSTVGDPFKLNNNHRALYARKIMRHEPDLARLFETRKDAVIGSDCDCAECHGC